MACSGTLKTFVQGKGFGFISRDDGEEDVFVHFSKLNNGGEADMVIGMRVAFDLDADDRSGKMRASNVTITAPGNGVAGGIGSSVAPLETSVTGVLKSFTEGKGFGFINRDDGKEDVFMHFSKLNAGSVEDMAVGMRVCFDVERDERAGKSRATNVTILSPGGGAVGSVGMIGGVMMPDTQVFQVETARSPPGLPLSDSGLEERRRIAENDAGEEQRRIPDSDGGGVYTYSELRAAFTEYSDTDLQGYWRDVCKVVAAKPAVPAQNADRGSTSMAPIEQPSSVVQAFRDWLLNIDASGMLLVYLSAFEENFDSVSQVVNAYTMRDGTSQMLDTQLFQDIGVETLEHRQLFETWFNAHKAGTSGTSTSAVSQEEEAYLAEQDAARRSEASRQEAAYRAQQDAAQRLEAERREEARRAEREAAQRLEDARRAEREEAARRLEISRQEEARRAEMEASHQHQVSASFPSTPNKFNSHGSAPNLLQSSMLLVVSNMKQAMHLASQEVGIANRAGVQILSEAGPEGKAVLRISGPPPCVGIACFLVQKAIWLNDFFQHTV